MKIVFAGPSVYGLDLTRFSDVSFRDPARKGDVVQAVKDGATAIGIIDGVFEQQSAVWHKEILLALSEGVPVYGAASMGALRAAECDEFGMIGIGEIYRLYASGEIEDDADVAQAHAPKELRFLPVSEAMVNVRATLRELQSNGSLGEREHTILTKSASGLFFKERTWQAIVRKACLSSDRTAELEVLLRTAAVNLKQRDALLLLEKINGHISQHASCETWQLARTPFLQT